MPKKLPPESQDTFNLGRTCIDGALMVLVSLPDSLRRGRILSHLNEIKHELDELEKELLEQ